MIEHMIIDLTPNKYLSAEAKYLRAKLLNNELNDSEIKLEIMHDKYNNYDPLALEAYCNQISIGYIQKFNSADNIDDFCFRNGIKITTLTLKWKDNNLYLSKSAHDIEETKTLNTDDSWVNRLWEWADERLLSEDSISRDKHKLLNQTEIISDEWWLFFGVALPPEIGNLTNLTSLNFNHCDLAELPPEIGNLTNLTSLNFDHCSLTELPPEIGNLTNLTSFDLSFNYLIELPPEIGNLTNLTSLNFDYSKLTELPPEIGNLTNLTSLNLRDNEKLNPAKLPPEIGNLTNLTSLNLGYFTSGELPPEIRNLTNLNIRSW